MDCYSVIFIFITLHLPVHLQSTKSAKDSNLHITPTKISSIEYVSTSDTRNVNPDLKSLWVYRPASSQSNPDDATSQHVFFKQPYLLTRLAKPLTFGFDPSFNKGYFEPFERRQKPVTLVAFRKNGQIPRKTLGVEQFDPSSNEVAEMQSSFNEISSFWHDIPGLYNI
ncbi:uncharacterized protein LOC116777778 [Danaus plexippus]|uniref:uncharacterized protein LOC116777778 n=1 Tax=Danaus plexippus TaxID=13037 RepID=UPI002AB2EB17|nr:uncharacterized protein LOC116777778 [Danaus plexippus]